MSHKVFLKLLWFYFDNSWLNPLPVRGAGKKIKAKKTPCQNEQINPGVGLIRSPPQQEHGTECPASRNIRRHISLTSRLSAAAWVEEFDIWDRNRLLQKVWVKKSGGFNAARRGKGVHEQGISILDKFVGNSWSHTGKLKQQEVAWDENRAPLAPALGGEAGMDSLVWNSSCSKSTQVCELGEACGKRARRACSLGRFFQVLRALIMMVGEERRFASVPLATCLYGL